MSNRKVPMLACGLAALILLACPPPQPAQEGPEETVTPADEGYEEPGVDELAPADGPAKPPDTVTIQILGNVGSRQWNVVPRGLFVCKKPTEDCGNQVKFRWIGPKVGDKVTIKPKADQPNCFDEAVIERKGMGPAEVTQTVKDACPANNALWQYDVICDACGEDPPPLDPMIIIGD